MSLGGYPQFAGSVGIDAGHAGVRFDIALVNLFGFIALLDDHIGLGKACLHITVPEFSHVVHIRRPGGFRLDSRGKHILVNHRRIGLNRLVHIGYMGQHLVGDLDQLQRLLRSLHVDRGDRGDRMAVVQGPAAGHAIFQYIPGSAVAVGQVGQIVTGNNRFHAAQLFRPGSGNFPDSGVGVGRAQKQSHQLSGCIVVGAVFGAAGHLVDAVRSCYAGADDFEFLPGIARIVSHVCFLSLFVNSLFCALPGDDRS